MVMTVRPSRFWEFISLVALVGILVISFATLILETTPTAFYPVKVQPVDPLITALHNRKQIKPDIVSAEIRRLAKLYARDGVTTPLLLAVVEVESGFQAKARGRAGEIGLMQIKPSTASHVLDLPISISELYDPVTNLRVGTAYLVSLHRVLVTAGYERRDQFEVSIIAYNLGLAKTVVALRAGAPVYLRHYTKVKRAMRRWEQFLAKEL